MTAERRYKMPAVKMHQMVKITKRCPFFGEKAQIVAKKDGKYGIQVASSLNTFYLRRKDFVIIHSKRAR
jgi:hypothetical protein